VFKRIKTYRFRDRICDLLAKTDTSLACAGLQTLLQASEYKVAIFGLNIEPRCVWILILKRRMANKVQTPRNSSGTSLVAPQCREPQLRNIYAFVNTVNRNTQ